MVKGRQILGAYSKGQRNKISFLFKVLGFCFLNHYHTRKVSPVGATASSKFSDESLFFF